MLRQSIRLFIGLPSAVVVIIHLSIVGLTKIFENFFRNVTDTKTNNWSKDQEIVQMLVKYRLFFIYRNRNRKPKDHVEKKLYLLFIFIKLK
jgi:hypothetical protein